MKQGVPVIFEGTMFPEISVVANPDFVKSRRLKVINEEVESNIGVECLNRDERRYIGELRVKAGAKPNTNIPYVIDILCVTSLQIDQSIPEENLESFAAQAAHAMAFPAVRELILTLTARQPWGQFSIGMSMLKTAKENTKPNKVPTATKKRPRIKAATSK